MFISTRLYYQQSLNSIMFVGILDFFQRHSPELSDSEDQYAPTRFTKFSFPKWSKKLGSLSPRLLYTSFFKRFGLLLTSSKKFITASWPWTFAEPRGCENNPTELLLRGVDLQFYWLNLPKCMLFGF